MTKVSRSLPPCISFSSEVRESNAAHAPTTLIKLTGILPGQVICDDYSTRSMHPSVIVNSAVCTDQYLVSSTALVPPIGLPDKLWFEKGKIKGLYQNFGTISYALTKLDNKLNVDFFWQLYQKLVWLKKPEFRVFQTDGCSGQPTVKTIKASLECRIFKS